MVHAEEWELLLLAYIDGELPAVRRAEVEDHLAHCPACRADLAAIKVTLGLPDPALPHTQADPAAFLSGVEHRAARAQLTERPEPNRSWFIPLLDREQSEPVRWFLFALPALGAMLSPGLRPVWIAAGSLVLGALLEYLLLRREVALCDHD